MCVSGWMKNIGSAQFKDPVNWDSERTRFLPVPHISVKNVFTRLLVLHQKCRKSAV